MNDQQRKLASLLNEIFPEDSWDDGVEQTANRVLRYWKEVEPKQKLPFVFTSFPAVSSQLIFVRDIEFSSLCSHHLLPFFGHVHIAYVPDKMQVGLSKIPRLVDFWAHRPQVQERLTQQIADDLVVKLKPLGVMVIIEAVHTCMTSRGIRKHQGSMTTSVALGVFIDDSKHARQEFLSLLRRA